MRHDGDGALLPCFLRGELSNDEFHHADHVRVAWEMLAQYSFVESARLYTEGLRTLCTKAGRPGAYHETITIAFLSLVAERMSADMERDFDAFAESNVDLFDKACLSHWYPADRLESDVARRTFILPAPMNPAYSASIR